MSRRRLVVPLVSLVVVLALAIGVAWAQWTSGSVPGGNGAAAAATVDRGATPTAAAIGNTVTVSWAASTLSDGDTVTGYLVKRFDATTLAAQTVLTACAGTVLTTSCTESALPSGTWVYSVTPVAGTFWTGAESATSNAVTTDGTPPVNAITAAATTGGAFANGDTVFYRGVAAGSLTLTNSVTDAGSGPAASTTSALTGTATGWNHNPSTVSSPAGGPYVSNPFSWTAGTTSAPTDVVTGRDVAGNEAATTMSFVNDSTAPTAGTVTYPDGYQPDLTVVVTFAAGTDSGSGIATRQLQRSAAAISAGLCGVFSGFADVGPDSPTSPYTDTAVTDGSCYQYRYVVTDQVGNQTVATSTNVAEVDSSAGGPALRSAKAFSVLAATGVVNSGATNLSGDLGLSPSGAISGFPPGTVGGAIHDRDAAAAQGQSDLVNVYNDAAARTPTGTFSGDLNGRTFHPGVYQTGAALALTGTMTLDGDGDSNSLFVFQVGAAMNTAAGSTVALVDGAQASHVFWQVLGAVGTGASSSMVGTIMAAGAITLGASTQLIGRALSQDTVTLSSNTVRFTAALPPVIAIDGGASAATKDVTPTISGTTNALAGSPVRVTVGGQVLTTTVQVGGTWGVTAATLPAGAYAVVASVKDAAGNGGSATQSLTVEVNPDPVVLGSAATFSVLAATGVVNTGATNLSGDLGLSPDGAISGFPPGTVGGVIHDRDATAAQGQADLASAYDEVSARRPHASFSGDLNGRTFHIGIYHTAAALALTGTVTLDAEGNPDAVFIFQVDAAMNTAAGSTVALVNGAQAKNVFWVVAGAVGTGASSSMVGTIMAAGAITLGAGTQLIGRALSEDTVTLSGNAVRFTTALPPVIAIDGGASAATKDVTPTITGTTNALTGRPVQVTVNGQVLTTTVQAGGAWGVTAATLPAGSYPVVASVEDAAGNGASVTQNLTVEVNPDPVALLSAATFSVLAATGVVNSGATDLSGDLGLSPSGAISGFPPGTVGGAIHDRDAAASQGQSDLANAYHEVAARTPHAEFAGDLKGRTFHIGIYHTTAAMALTGTMTLDAEGNPNAVFIFQVGAAMNTAASSQVVLANGAQASNVFWVVAGAVTTGGSSSMAGTIMAAGAITLGAGTQLVGRALSQGTVTLSSNPVTTG